MGDFQGKVVHIAGSKGKGTAAILLSRILEWNGYRVGTFTSPFFLEEEEMIQVNGTTIPKERLRAVPHTQQTIEAKLRRV